MQTEQEEEIRDEGVTEEALRIAKLRERYTLDLIHSRNRLATYTPVIITYSLFVFIVGTYTMYYYYCDSTSLFPTCSSFEIQLRNDYCYLHHMITGAYGGTLALTIVQIIDFEKTGLLWNARYYCFATITTIGFWTSLTISQQWFPYHYNAFQQIIIIPRLLQWLCTTPTLMFVMYSLDVRTADDENLIWISVASQQFSIISGLISNLTHNYTVAVIFIVFAPLSVLFVIIFTYYCFRRIGFIVASATASEDEDVNVRAQQGEYLDSLVFDNLPKGR